MNSAPPAQLLLKPAQPNEKVGSTFQMDINLNGGHDVFAVPLQVHYDNSRLQLVNVDMATRRITNFLGRDGQAVALAHRDDGNGNVAIAVSRPPGTTGITGSGTVCVLTFKAKAPGNAQVAIMTPAIRNSRQQVLPAIGSDAVVHIQ
jgi:general secretion pathway protein D